MFRNCPGKRKTRCFSPPEGQKKSRVKGAGRREKRMATEKEFLGARE